MKTLLLNGCSFGEIWKPSQNFILKMRCSGYTNISRPATSFQRTCRSTIEWMAQNGDPGFVIIPMTFAHRWELGIADKTVDSIDGVWYPLQTSDLIDKDNAVKRRINPTVDRKKLAKLLELYYGLIPDQRTYWDKMFTEMIMLSGFLSSRNVPHLFFDMCNNFQKNDIEKWSGFEKLLYITSNKSVVDLYGFCGNKYMQQSLDSKQKFFNVHHKPEQYLILESYLQTYVEQNFWKE